MPKQTLQIHSENIMPIIKKWLYSNNDIFIRELASNACDAIYKVIILRDQGELQAIDADFKIDIIVNKQDRTLKFIDNGIGMDAEEVVKYIAQIAFSGAEDFLNKYKSNKEGDQFIGHFGLGFYSAYMVADKVEINTLSYKPQAEPVFWSCDGSSEYLLEKGSRQTRGTEITLYIGKDHEEFLEIPHLKQILHHYCAFLPYPIYLENQLINAKEPLWVKSPAECTQQDYLEFYRYLYPLEEDPLFWVHLNVDYPFHLKGILYFPKIKRDFDPNKNSIKLFCNRVFVSDNCKDIIPNYLMALRGVIDSPDIPLNVSRSYLQMDRTVRQLSNHISKKVSDSLSMLYRTDRNRFISCWENVSIVVKLGILEDEKFYERAKEFLIWKNVKGEWLTINEYIDLHREKTKEKIFYTSDEKHLSHFQEIYQKKGIDILCANSSIDLYLMQFLEKKLSPMKFQRVDASIEDHLLDKEREKTILDASGRTEAAKLADFVRSKLSEENLEVEAKSLASDSLPGFIMIDEHQRRLRDYMLTMDHHHPDSLSLLGKRTFVINTNNPLLTAAYKLNLTQPQLAKEIVHQAYELALLSQHEMKPNALNDFISRTYHLLEKLSDEALRTNDE